MSDRSLGLDVSRETLERLEHYLALLNKWNPAINLVSKSTLDEAWSRHFIDSVQVFKHAPKNWTHWADLGSGGGFPGAVIAILAAEFAPESRITLVESDQRKSAFLRTVLRETEVDGQVIAQRIELAIPLSADVISARALADLSRLFEFVEHHQAQNTTCLFPKGANWEKEVKTAQESWSFDWSPITSETDAQAVVLKIGDVHRA